MIYISFFRKKTTKIYLFIFMALIFIFLLLLNNKNKYLELANIAYKGSHIYINSKYDIQSKLEKIKNIKSVKRGYGKSYNAILALDKPTINDNEIIIPKILEESYPLNSLFNLEVVNYKKEFIVKDYTTEQTILYISPKILEEILVSSSNYYYVLDLKNWAYSDKTFSKDILNKYPDTKAILGTTQQGEIDYKSIVSTYNIFININIIIFIIVFIISIINIIEDEKKYNKLYWSLGYAKKKIKIQNTVKIVFIIFVASITAILAFVFINILK